MTFEMVPFAECELLLDWQGLTEALQAGHRLPKAEIKDMFLYRDFDTLLSRSAWINGLGIVVKSATIFPENTNVNKPVVNGGVCLYSDTDGALEALVDFHLVTKWKTAGDSLLAAKKLARADSENILIVGSGVVAQSLVEAYRSAFPEARFHVWSRTRENAKQLADKYNIEVADDLEAAVRTADIVTCATMSSSPVVLGEWLQPGQHIDLIGAYRPDMREADDEVMRRGRIFVDSRETTLDHIGELKTPLEQGVIGREDVVADYYDLASGRFARSWDDEITVFKNGGGAHLDLMTGRYILEAWRNR
ncbi:MAG: ornithine cyclodeaminase family protein [Paracoccaceae bacterium]